MATIISRINLVWASEPGKRTYIVDLHDFLPRKPVSVVSADNPILTLNGWLLTMEFLSVDMDNPGNPMPMTIDCIYDDVVAL
jgi:hypothetical protein